MYNLLLKYNLALPATISSIFAYYTDLKFAIYALLIITSIDTASKIHYTGIAKGIPFNPLKKIFWTHITSGGLRQMAKKVFGEYFKYIIILFVVDHFILHSAFKVPFIGRNITLPIAGIYFFTLIEIRSIFENIGKNGGTNWLSKIVKLLPKNVQTIYNTFFKKDADEIND